MDDSKDNCPFHANPDQLDTDKDGQGKSEQNKMVILVNLNRSFLTEYLSINRDKLTLGRLLRET